MLRVRHRDPGQLHLGHQAVLQRGLRRLEAEESHPLPGLGDVHCKLQRQRRLAGGGIRADDDEGPRRDRERSVQKIDPESEIIHRLRIVHPVDVRRDHLAQRHAVVRLRVSQHLPHALVAGHGIGHVFRVQDCHGFGLQGCELRLVPQRREVSADIRSRRRHLHAVRDQVVVFIPGPGHHRHRVDRPSVVEQIPRGLEDMAHGGVPEHGRDRALEDQPGHLVRRDHQRADHGALRQLPVAQFSHMRFTSWPAGFGRRTSCSSSQRRWLSHLQR